VNDQNARYIRLRYTATGALAALAAAGAVAGTVALAAGPPAKTHRHAAVATGSATKTAPSGVPVKTEAPPPPVDHQPFLDAIQQLVGNGTITATEAQVVDREIVDGRVDTDTLAASGFTPAQLDAVSQALGSAKRALAPGVTGAPKGGKARHG
jgi:hypothetical protein